MRVIAGSLGGRHFDSPHGHRTHPMSDKIRGALFNILGDIDGLTVLDAFAGSGALSFEAISRGAASAVAIDIDKNAHSIIEKNISSLSLQGRVKAIRAGATSWSENNISTVFDVVLCDPPYDDVKPQTLIKMASHTKPGGVVVYSLPPSVSFTLPTDTYEHISTKNYGDSQLLFLSRLSS